MLSIKKFPPLFWGLLSLVIGAFELLHQPTWTNFPALILMAIGLALLIYHYRKARHRHAYLDDASYVAALAKRLIVTEHGFQVQHRMIAWDELTRIMVSQEPQEKTKFTFHFDARQNGVSLKLQEELSSFEKPLLALQEHYQFPANWRQEFKYVVGRAKEVVLYERKAAP